MDVIVPTRNSIASVARNLNDKTDTIFHYSHTPLKKWFIVLSILCIVAWMLYNGNIITDPIFHITYATDSLELLWRESLVLLPSQIMLNLQGL